MFGFTGEPSSEWATGWTWEGVDASLQEHKERFLMKGSLKEKVMDEEWVIVLTDKGYYKIERDSNAPRRRKDITSLHSVVDDPDDPNAFFVFAYKHLAKFQAIQTLSAVGVSKLALDYSAFLQKRHFVCASSEERFQWVLVFNALMRESWQQALEAAVISAPELYQYHACVIKLNRKGKAQDRVIAFSDTWIYNIEPARGDGTASAKEYRWALPFSSIKLVQLTHSKDKMDIGPSATVYFDVVLAKKALADSPSHQGAKGDDANDSHTFCFRTDSERSAFVSELARLFYMNQGHLSENDPKRCLSVDAMEDMSPQELGKRQSYSTGEAKEQISGPLEKFTGGGKGSHQKYVILYANGMIEWKDSPEARKGNTARVLSISAGLKELKHKKDLTSSQQDLIFTVQTTSKTLHFLAPSKSECDRWVRALEENIQRRTSPTGRATAI